MRRRVLRLASSSSSSDEEEEDDEQTTTTTTVAPDPNPVPDPHSTPLPDSPVTISDDNDDGFVTGVDDLSTPSPPVPNPNPGVDPRIAPIDEFLTRLGLKIRPEFLEFCYEKISAVTNGFEALNVDLKAKKCFEQLLLADLNQIGAGILPQNINQLHKSELEGPFVLQVDEIVNISAPIKDRYQNCPAGAKRCLKLCMTDGATRVVGIEYRPIRELEVLASSGFKVVIKNVQVRHGVLMLVPEIINILGGTVNYLDEARQRLVNEVNKPPRGKKKNGGLTLSQRAALAAWPNNNNNNNNNSTNTEMPAGNSQRNIDTPAGNSQRNYSAIPQSERVVSQSTTGISNVFPSTVSGVTTETIRTNHSNTANVFPNTVSGVTVTTEISMQDANNNYNDNLYEEEEAYLNEINTEYNNNNNNNNNNNLYEEEEAYLNGINTEINIIHNVGPHVSGGINSVQERENDVLMDDLILDEMKTDNNNNNNDDGLILSGEREKPFTYFSFLQEKWEREKETKPFIRGKIKCFLMGVKGFAYKDKYDLRVLIDDGSRISQIQIDHNVVEKEIGYSSEQVKAGLASSDEETRMNMILTMKNFQFFVRQFEGTMVIEFNKSSSLPIAIEWNQGFSSSDAKLLLQRLKD